MSDAKRETEMNEQTKTFVKDLISGSRNEAQAAEWIARWIRCSIQAAREILAEVK